MLKDLFMALDSKGKIFGRAVARAACRPGWVRVITLNLLLVWALMLQGCLAGVWVAVVAVDTVRNSYVPDESREQSGVEQVAVNSSNSNVVFGQFEKSWVAQQGSSNDPGYSSKVTSVAVLQVEGDPEMAARLATLLQQETSLRVESPVTVPVGATAVDLRSGDAEEANRSALAKEVTQDLGVDTILVSRVTGSPSHPSDWGWKAEGTRRLHLYLVNREGRLLWKDELPFTLVNGSRPPSERSVQTDLTHRVMQHVAALHLDDLGYLPNKEKRTKFKFPSATLKSIERPESPP